MNNFFFLFQSMAVWDVSRSTTRIYLFDSIHPKKIDNVIWISSDMLLSSSPGTVIMTRIGHPRAIKTFSSFPGRGVITRAVFGLLVISSVIVALDLFQGPLSSLRWNADLQKFACCSSDSKVLTVQQHILHSFRACLSSLLFL